MTAALNIFASHLPPPGTFPGGKYAIASLTGAADAFLAVCLSRDLPVRTILSITPGIPEADRLSDDLKAVLSALPANCAAKRTRLLEYPPLLEGDKSALGTRLKTIAALEAWSLKPYPCIIIAPSVALSAAIPESPIAALKLETDPASMESAPVKFGDIGNQLAALGYKRVPFVEQEGDYSIRGGIIDAWNPGDEFPVRAEFFGDQLESLRSFDCVCQRSIDRIATAEFMPIVETVTENRPQKTIFELLPKQTTIIAFEHNSYSLPDITRKFPVVFSGEPAPEGIATHNLPTSPLPGFAELGADEAHHPELFDAARQRLEQHLTAAEARGEIILHLDELSLGFEIPGLIVVTKADRVFTKKKPRVFRRTQGAGRRLNDFDDLEPGEYVVHLDHGIGRFIGSTQISVEGKLREVFSIEYADGAKLHVPASHAHLLSRYVGVKGEQVHLHRLDGKKWNKDKAAAQKAVSDLACALLETQAKREIVPGFGYNVDCDGLDAFEAAFPYAETEDQLEAIAAVKRDLAARKPMDRLICGDAGYGKTEVAMRAAYIAAMNGKQTAVLAPTTVLAEQHFETFTSRFDSTPVRIESVSRFQSAAAHSGTFKRLASGACDIAIGTHALLSPKIAFRDLGLIIIDEEQRFGVRHKEFLKKLRATADVLTLSATPIPRTLYLSMTGARDFSLLRTPPHDRVAVATSIVRDSDETVRTAVEAELSRGGQVFFLHNRVGTIDKAEKRLREIFGARPLPSTGKPIRIITAHGQMDSRELARRMRDFERGMFDVLLATTIIESGIDIPRANTIIVDQAHTFGLADLYQLRGRVGRSSRQGRAIFLLPPEGLVDQEARERLAALKRHSGLGAGFNLAVRDLELRGAGNLLGAQQSGHIATVGFSLYCQMLKRTIAALKGEKVQDIVDVRLDLDFVDFAGGPDDDAASAAIPSSYVEEETQRMSIMKRLGETMDARAVKDIADELADRFGKIPAAASRLLRLAELRICAAKNRIERIDVRASRAVFYDAGSREIAFVRDLKSKSPDGKIGELMRLAKLR